MHVCSSMSFDAMCNLGWDSAFVRDEVGGFCSCLGLLNLATLHSFRVYIFLSPLVQTIGFAI